MKRLRPLLLIPVLALAGCPHLRPPDDEKDLRPINPPRHPADVISDLNARAAAATPLRARGKVAINWTDDKNNTHSDAADGVLLIRQRPTPAGNLVEAVLFGNVASQNIFELGENENHYWMATRVDRKTAWVGTRGSEADRAGRGPIPARAARVPEVLGVVRLGGPRQQPLVLTNPTTVDISVIHAGTIEGNPPWIERVMTYSRRGAGDLQQVRLYKEDGRIEATARLWDFRDVPTRAKDQEPEDPPAGPAVRLPFKLQITYHLRAAQITLEVDRYEPGAALKDVSFAMPDFARQGLKVETIK